MPGRVRIVLTALLLLPAALTSEWVVAQGQEPADQPAFSIPDNEKPFWEAAQKFVDAYAARDAAAIGAMFTDDAEIFDEFGEVTLGQDAIVEMYQQVFEEFPEASISEINLNKVRHITDNVAIEEGRVVSSAGGGETPSTSRYVAIHVREEGVWRIDMLKNFAQEGLSRSEHLERLSWLVGEWISEDEESVVHTECNWSDDGNYLLRQFTVRIAGDDVMSGVQRLGWDPVRKQIRSWTFDSQGGFVQGNWKQNNNQWIVVSNGVNSDGETASGTAIYTIIDAEMITWQYRNLVVGNEIREDIEPIVMIRRPPAPETASK